MSPQERSPFDTAPSMMPRPDGVMDPADIPTTTPPAQDFVRRTNEVTAPINESDVGDEAPPVRIPSQEEAHIPGKWQRAKWIVESRKRRKEKLKQDALESRTGVHTFLTMASMSINKAIETEPNSSIRPVKRRMLQDRWRQWQQDLLGIIRR